MAGEPRAHGTRAELEAGIWAISGRTLTGRQVDQLLALADTYRADAHNPPGRPLRHTHGTDLWPVIAALADALLGDATHLEAAS